jgi:hypothetical protein
MKIVNQKEVLPRAGAVAAAMILTVGLLLTGSDKVWAGAASKVYMPNVEMGETEFEILGGYANEGGDGEREYKAAIGHGMTQNWYSELEFEWEKAHGASTKYEEWEWINIFKLTEQGQYFVDVGLFTELKFPDEHDAPEKLEIGPMFQKRIGPAMYNLNLIWVRDFGRHADHDTDFEYAFQARVKGEPILEYGFQAFGEFGDWSDMAPGHDQEHKLGPAIFGTVKSGHGSDKIAYDAALLFGATDDTADYTLRFAIEYEMY